MCKERLDEMRELVKQIPDHNRVKNVYGEVTELFVLTGFAFAQTLFRDKDGKISVAKTVIAEGTEFECHTHGQLEVFSIYKGTLILTVKDPNKKKNEKVTLNEGDVYVLQKHIPHNAKAPVRTEMIVQLIPSP